MKFFNNNKKKWPVLALLSASFFCVQNAHASSDFSSSAIVTYTINSITNTTGTATDLSGLSITGGYTTDVFSSFIDIPVASDGVASPFALIGDQFVDPVIAAYSKAMNVSGSVSDGAVEAFYLGLFDLSFDNASANSFDIQITLDYDLTASANGLFAENTIQLDYVNEAGTFDSGLGLSAFVASPYASPDVLTGSVVYNFTLASGAFDALYTDVGITGNIEASPVPVPAAFWLFGTALVIPALRRLKLHSIKSR